MIILFLIILFSAHSKKTEYTIHELHGKAQGTTWRIKYLSDLPILSTETVDSIFRVIDYSLSLYQPASLINQFNAGKNIQPDEHFVSVVKKSISIYKESNGAFDITLYPLTKAWGFMSSSTISMPDSIEIEKLKKCIGSQYLKVSRKRIKKSKDCLQIDCNGIAQGYTVDRIADFLNKRGILNYLVELGGEIRVKGINDKHKPWSIGIQSPMADSSTPAYTEQIIQLTSGAITTSGNYKNYRIYGNKVYGHVIDPRSGYPVDNGIISVTVWAKDAVTADGYDNALFVLGINDSFELLSRQRDIQAFFIYRKPDGSITDTCTPGFRKMLSHQ